jgi:hypothetical protein
LLRSRSQDFRSGGHEPVGGFRDRLQEPFDSAARLLLGLGADQGRTEVFTHLVECQRQASDLVAARDQRSGRQVAATETLGSADDLS